MKSDEDRVHASEEGESRVREREWVGGWGGERVSE
jgi:hypothetical protein